MKQVTANRAWAVLGSAVVVYEIVCPPGELLSQGVDRWLINHPIATTVAVATTAAHLLNLLPALVDPYVTLNLLRPETRWRKYHSGLSTKTTMEFSTGGFE